MDGVMKDTSHKRRKESGKALIVVFYKNSIWHKAVFMNTKPSAADTIYVQAQVVNDFNTRFEKCGVSI